MKNFLRDNWPNCAPPVSPVSRLTKCRRAKAIQARRVVFIFDDGFVNVLTHALDPLAANGFRAIQFLVADRIGQMNEWNRADGEVLAPLMDAAQIRDWLTAGHQIGSHTLTHPYLTRLSLAQAREEITASKKKLENLFRRGDQTFLLSLRRLERANARPGFGGGLLHGLHDPFRRQHFANSAGRVAARHGPLSEPQLAAAGREIAELF